MRTPSTIRILAEKKTVPVKWRDNSWYPRIVIRSVTARGPSLGFWEDNAFMPGGTDCLQGAAIRLRRLGRAGSSPKAARCDAVTPRATLPYGRLRSLPGSRLDNPI